MSWSMYIPIPNTKRLLENFKAELIAQMERYNEPALRKGRLIY